MNKLHAWIKSKHFLTDILFTLMFAIIALVGFFLYQYVHYNIHTVIKGKIYRSALLPAHKLRQIIRKDHLWSVINLRNGHPKAPWYLSERHAVVQHHRKLYNVSLPAHHLPTRFQLLALIRTLEKARQPYLIHCESGADRTGLASALALILFKNVPLLIARKQVSYKYLAFSPHSVGRLVLPRYQKWLQHHHVKSSKQHLLEWADSYHK